MEGDRKKKKNTWGCKHVPWEIRAITHHYLVNRVNWRHSDVKHSFTNAQRDCNSLSRKERKRGEERFKPLTKNGCEHFTCSELISLPSP
jgi:hypothetical protein